MSDKLTDILQDLREHQQSPPENLLASILLSIQEEKNNSSPIGVNPISLPELKNHHINPPPGLYPKIKKGLISPDKKAVSLFKIILTGRRIAAVLLLALSAWLIFYLSTKKNTTAGYDPSISNPAPALKKELPISTTTTPDVAVSKKESISKTTFKNTGLAKSLNKGIFKNLQIDGKIIEVVDNDLLYTLFNCNYKILKPYLESEDKKLVMGLDIYSSVTVSPKMISFMKTMYATKKRNKPTRKARKAIKALDKWKKTDREYFESQGKANPLDIIDLSEFIFDKKKQ